jgi:hypothetical protein
MMFSLRSDPLLGRKRCRPHARAVAQHLLDATTEPLRHINHISALLKRHTNTAFAPSGASRSPMMRYMWLPSMKNPRCALLELLSRDIDHRRRGCAYPWTPHTG